MDSVRCAGRSELSGRNRALHTRREDRVESRKSEDCRGRMGQRDPVQLRAELCRCWHDAMYFVPGLGPVVYETTSIAGPVRWELIYSRAGINRCRSAPSRLYSRARCAGLQGCGNGQHAGSLDAAQYASQPVTLNFPSGQRYDLRIWNDKGQVVYTWSADKLFPQVLSRKTSGLARTTFPFIATVPNLPAGRYVAEAWLATVQSRVRRHSRL